MIETVEGSKYEDTFNSALPWAKFFIMSDDTQYDIRAQCRGKTLYNGKLTLFELIDDAIFYRMSV